MKLALINAKIYQEAGQFAQALLVEDGIVREVGSNQAVTALEPDEVIDCQGKTLIPGFNDSHSHLTMVTELRQQVGLLDSSSINEVLERSRAFLDERPGLTLLQGMGWNPAHFSQGEARNLTRHDLDQISTDIPILLTRACGHMIVTNTKALEMAGVTKDTPQIPGGVFEIDDDGPNGRFFENARELIMHLKPALTTEELIEAMKDTVEYALSLGITTVQTNDIGLFRPLDEMLHIYQSLYACGSPMLKTHHQMCFDTPEEFSDFLNTAYLVPLPAGMSYGPLKLFKDGTLGGRSAMVSDGYLDSPDNYGLDVTPIEKAKPFLDLAKQHGMQVYSHCIGDKAMEEMIDAYQPLSPDDRWGLVHCQITHPKTLEKMARYGVVGVIQPIFVRADVAAMQGVIPEATQATSYAWKTMLELGVPIAIGTDAPVEDLNPFVNLYTAIARRNLTGQLDSFLPHQALTIEQALDGYTIGSAYAEFKETSKGRLLPGYVADMALLDRDIFTIEPEELLDAKAVMTFIDGQLVYQD